MRDAVWFNRLSYLHNRLNWGCYTKMTKLQNPKEIYTWPKYKTKKKDLLHKEKAIPIQNIILLIIYLQQGKWLGLSIRPCCTFVDEFTSRLNLIVRMLNKLNLQRFLYFQLILDTQSIHIFWQLQIYLWALKQSN